MNIENRLFELIGEDAGYIHTARSRNDQVVTDFKIWLRKANKEIVKNIYVTIKNILKKAEKNVETIMPGFTHLKNAQPVSFAHYLMAYLEMFNRDKNRFKNNLDITFDEEVSEEIFRLCMNQEKLEETSVIDFQKLFSKIP